MKTIESVNKMKVKRKCLSCDYYCDGVCNMGENGTEYDEPSCELGFKICGLNSGSEWGFYCNKTDEQFNQAEIKLIQHQNDEADYWNFVGHQMDYINKVCREAVDYIIKNIDNMNEQGFFNLENFLFIRDIKLEIREHRLDEIKMELKNANKTTT